jgi:hypothetical protein
VAAWPPIESLLIGLIFSKRCFDQRGVEKVMKFFDLAALDQVYF